MIWLERLLGSVTRIVALVPLIPERFTHRTRQSLTEYLGALVVLGAVGAAAASVGLA